MASSTNTPTDDPRFLLTPSPDKMAASPRPSEDGGSGSSTKQKSRLDAKKFFYSLAEWENVDLNTPDDQVLIGTPTNSIIRPGTKNIVEAPEKTFKTTMLLRLTIGMASGHTVYPSLPVARPVRVLYMHGEMTPSELAERQISAQCRIPAEALAVGRATFIAGRCITAHLTQQDGQNDIRRVVGEYKPDVLVLDPWQSFITGCDENTFKDISQATHFLDGLMADHQGLTLFLVVHQGKNHTRGARGHSSIAGWRDTLIRLTGNGGSSIRVEVLPRWGNPVSFKLRFAQGTMTEGEPFSPQSAKIRKFVKDENGWVPRAEIERFLVTSKDGSTNKDATKKAIQRAVQECAITEGTGPNKGSFGAGHSNEDDDDIFNAPII